MKNVKSTFVKEQQALCWIRDSLIQFYSVLHSNFTGRFPNEVRAMFQGVNAAISCAAPDGSLAAIASAVGANPEKLAEGRRHWMQWISGDREAVMDLRGKVRSDKMDESWVAHGIQTWFDETRRSANAKDSMRNPHNRSHAYLNQLVW